MKTLQEIRNLFINYFAEHGHKHVPSSGLIPQNDPTLMFTNAGMVQFKDMFTGLVTPTYTKAVTSQKCLRAGGKHNDLENVGYTARHHTFFEMLGNFSFGDYFKEEAIYHAWNLITSVYQLPKDRLWVTVYHDDTEAANLWKKIANFSDDRIISIASNDNFWSMGDTGPCGPCSEIFYDHGDHIPGGLPGTPEQDGDRFIEIWNLVFMQFNQNIDGTRQPLPKPSIDTGMGLERISTILQGVHDNFDIDLFQKIIKHSQDLTKNAEEKSKFPHRIIADHLRASSFLVADGVLPSNEGRGYVLRRIMRRAMRHAHMLGAKEPLMWKLVPTLVDLMGQSYPELANGQTLIEETLRAEEEKFRQTLDRGLKILDEERTSLKTGDLLPGTVAFKLYDTYGFPVDLTQDILKSDNIQVDMEGFNNAMKDQQALARSSWAGSGETKDNAIWYELSQELEQTDFIGYDSLEAQTQISKIIIDNQIHESTHEGGTISVITPQTSFYPQGGGQVGDKGFLYAPNGEIEIIDTQKRGQGLIVHIGIVKKGTVKQGDLATLQVDKAIRNKTRANHSCTHLLHASLRHILGDKVVQKGSYVDSERLRFDFTYSKPLSNEQLCEIENFVNSKILENLPVLIRVMSPEKAIEQGALALFGEKYGAEVRVISMGLNNDCVSIELCGGTHITRTGDIGLFKILSEAGISSGVRRIEAVTGIGAMGIFSNTYSLIQQLSSLLKTTPEDVLNKTNILIQDKRILEKEIKEVKKTLLMQGGLSRQDQQDPASDAVEKAGMINIITRSLHDIPANDLKSLADDLKIQIKSGVILLTSVTDQKVSLIVSVTPDLTTRINAIDLVKQGALILGGKGGGGRPDMAQAGGTNPDAINNALAEIKNTIASMG